MLSMLTSSSWGSTAYNQLSWQAKVGSAVTETIDQHGLILLQELGRISLKDRMRWVSSSMDGNFMRHIFSRRTNLTTSCVTSRCQAYDGIRHLQGRQGYILVGGLSRAPG